MFTGVETILRTVRSYQEWGPTDNANDPLHGPGMNPYETHPYRPTPTTPTCSHQRFSRGLLR